MLGTLGFPEIVVLLALALVIFGPRKLPELAHTLGRAMNAFRQASQDFTKTLEREVESERPKAESERLPAESERPKAESERPKAESPAPKAVSDATPGADETPASLPAARESDPPDEESATVTKPAEPRPVKRA